MLRKISIGLAGLAALFVINCGNPLVGTWTLNYTASVWTNMSGGSGTGKETITLKVGADGTAAGSFDYSYNTVFDNNVGNGTRVNCDMKGGAIGTYIQNGSYLFATTNQSKIERTLCTLQANIAATTTDVIPGTLAVYSFNVNGNKLYFWSDSSSTGTIFTKQ